MSIATNENESLLWNEHALLDEALQTAGRKHFADESFLEPMRALLLSLSEGESLNATGRVSMRRRVLDLLVNRLRTEEYLERYPEIREETILAPTVIVGLPRTGTTLLHRLLSCDPNTHSVAWWENKNPAPFPGGAWGEADPRIPEAHRQVRAILEAVPELAATHPWDPEGPDEEFFLLEHSFYTFYSTVPIDMPAYASWLEGREQTAAYRYLKQMLQFLQWQKRQANTLGERWVLKAPRHLSFIEELFAVFPDARIIQTHRDPLQTIPSIASMYYSLRKLVCDDPDPVAIGEACKAHYDHALRHCMQVRERMPPAQFIDVDYRDVVRDPLAEVRRIYAGLGHSLSVETESEMQRWVEANRRDKRAPHLYTLDEFNFTEEGIAEQFAAYRQRHVPQREGTSR